MWTKRLIVVVVLVMIAAVTLSTYLFALALVRTGAPAWVALLGGSAFGIFLGHAFGTPTGAWAVEHWRDETWKR